MAIRISASRPLVIKNCSVASKPTTTRTPFECLLAELFWRPRQARVLPPPVATDPRPISPVLGGVQETAACGRSLGASPCGGVDLSLAETHRVVQHLDLSGPTKPINEASARMGSVGALLPLQTAGVLQSNPLAQLRAGL